MICKNCNLALELVQRSFTQASVFTFPVCNRPACVLCKQCRFGSDLSDDQHMIIIINDNTNNIINDNSNSNN